MSTARLTTTFLALCWLAWTGTGTVAATDSPAMATGFTPASGDTVIRQQALARLQDMHASGLSDSLQAELEPLLKSARADGDSSFVLDLLLIGGSNHAAYGKGREGEAPLLAAVALAEALADSTRLCQALRWLSVAVGLQGRMSEAHELYVRLQETARACEDLEHEGWALVGLAWEANTRGQAEQAARDFQRAAELFSSVGQYRGEIWAVNGLGTALSRLGRYREARLGYERSARLGRDHDVPMVEAMALNNLGNLELSLGDPGQAEKRFDQAADLHRHHGHLRESVIPGLNLALCQVRQRRYRDAEANLERLHHLCQDQGYHDLEGNVLNEMARVQRSQGRLHAAAALHRATLRLGDNLPLVGRLNAMIGLAQVLAEADSIDSALAILAEGEVLLQEHQHLALELDLSALQGRLLLAAGSPADALTRSQTTDRIARRHGFKDYRVRALATAASAWRALDRPDSALACLEEAAQVWSEERSLPLDPDWRELRGASGQWIHTELATLLLDHPAEDAPSARARRAFDRLQAFKARTLLERMLGPGEMLAQHAQTTLQKLQTEVLAPSELFLDMYLGPDHSLLFAVTSRECRAVSLPPAGDLEQKVRLYHELLAAPGSWDHQALALAGAGIRQLLLGEVVDLVNAADRICVSADGALNLLPFGVLPLSPGGLLADDREWVRTPSATILASLRSRSRSFANGDMEPALQTLALAGRTTDAGRAIPGARHEVRQLGRRYHGVEVRFLPARNEVGLSLADLARFDVIHLATHARIDDQRPWNSSIWFGEVAETGVTTDRDPATAGRAALRAREVAGLRLSSRLAVLSSCESGAGGILTCEGVVGLANAFLVTGVPAVLATLWPVDDRATAELMIAFYEGLADGHPAAHALREAQRHMSEMSGYGHPFYWAGFIVVGDGAVGVPLVRKWVYLPLAPLDRLAGILGPIGFLGFLVLTLGALALVLVAIVTLFRGKSVPKDTV